MAPSTAPGIRDAVYSPDGKSVAVTLDDAIRVMSADGALTPFAANVPGAIAENDPAWSPDGSQIAFAADANGEWDLWIASAKGGAPKRITSAPGDERWPSFTHDGRLVYSHREHRGVWQLFAIATSGSGQPTKLTLDDAGEWQASVSPDGKSIAFVSDRDAAGTNDLWKRDLAAGPGVASPSIRLTTGRGPVSSPVWSRTLTKTALAADPTAPRAPVVTAPPEVLYAVENGQQSGVWVVPANGIDAEVQRVQRLSSIGADAPAVAPRQLSRRVGTVSESPDGATLLIATSPSLRTAYNGDPLRNDDQAPVLPTTRNDYHLYGVTLGDKTETEMTVATGDRRDWTSAFGQVWQTLKALYYKTGDAARQWDALEAKYAPRITSAADANAAEHVIDQLVAEQPLTKSGATSSKAVITSGNPLASAAGAEILAKGGNLVDAAIATSFALGVTEPDASTIGGDGMCLLFLKGMSAPIAIDYKDMSVGVRPQNAPRQPDGPSVTNIPGIVAGMGLLYEKYGSHKVQWADLLAPAIRLADEGFILDDALPTTIAEQRASYSKYPETMKVFMPGGRIPRAGDRFVNKDYANTLRTLATEGADSFYHGTIAKRIVEDFAANGGYITADDLAQYHAVERTPLVGHYRGHLVYSVPPPSPTGAQMIETLQILDNYHPKTGATYANNADFLHYVLDAWRVRGGTPTRIGDPDRMTVDLGDALTPEHALERFKLIDPTKAYAGGGGRGGDALDDDASDTLAPSHPRTLGPWDPGTLGPSDVLTGTTSFALADADGDMIVFTQTLSTWGGGSYVSKGLGFLYNDHGRGGGQPHSRSSSTTVPTMLFAPATGAGENAYGIPGFVPFMASGCAGNSWIPASVYDVIVNVVDSHMDAQHAIEAPRLLISQRTQIEDRIPQLILGPLEAMGHQFQIIGRKGEVRQGYASVVIVHPDTHTVEAGAEPRRSHGAVGVK